MSTTVQAPPKVHPARQKALESFLERLRGWNAAESGEHDLDRKARITIGDRAVTLEPWERQQLRRWFEGGDGGPAHLGVLAHGAALMLKAAFDIERLIRKAEADSTTLYALQAELMLDTAIGMALLKDAQSVIDDLVKGGEFEAAKGLTQFRHRLSRVVSDAKMCIAESERAQAEAIATTLTDRPERPQRVTPPTAPSRSAPPAPAIEGTTARDMPLEETPDLVVGPTPPPIRARRQRPTVSARAANTKRGPSGTQVLMLMCLVNLVIWLAFVVAPRHMANEPVVMTRALFREGLPIGNVESRAPSVYVSMSQILWGAMSEREQQDLLLELGRTASRENYTGLLLRTEEGMPLGHWLAQRGATIIDAREEGAQPAIPTMPAAPPPPAPTLTLPSVAIGGETGESSEPSVPALPQAESDDPSGGAD